MVAEDVDAARLLKYTYTKSRIVDHNLDDADLESRCPLDNGRHVTTRPRSFLGKLDLLPLELITGVLLALDLPTLTAFRRVNQSAMNIVDILRPYSMIVRHCPNVLRAVLSIEATSYDCQSLFETLSTSKCITCGRFGGYLYLITCERVCYYCYTSHPAFLPIPVTRAAQATGRTRKDLKRLPHIRSLPGKYTNWEKSSKVRGLLWDQRAIMGDSSGTSAQKLAERSRKQDFTTRETVRFMSIISAPCFGPAGSTVDWGFWCVRCRDGPGTAGQFRVKFTKDAILDHIAGHESQGTAKQ